MNYEELLAGLQTAQKALKDGAAAATRQQKTLVKNVDNGYLAEMKKTLASLAETAAALQANIQEAEGLISGFDM